MTKTKCIRVTDLQYADDSVVISKTPDSMQRLTTSYVEAYRAGGLEINAAKTKVMSFGCDMPFDIQVEDTSLEQVTNFSYLGSVISTSCSADEEILSRIRAAYCAFGKLYRLVFGNRDLRRLTKCKVYRAVVVSALTYGCESWTLYKKHLRSLERFHQQKLRQILGIRWDDYVRNTEVLRRAQTDSIGNIISRAQLRWLGHLHRMDDARLPKQMLYGELRDGSRPANGPKRRWKDQAKQTLKVCRIDSTTWELAAANRGEWRRTVAIGLKAKEETEREASDARARRRRQRELHPPPADFRCPHCPRLLRSRLGLHSHVAAHERRTRTPR